ncbi:hypothetical protein [Mycolicibacterium sediminis]|uniref:Intersectin-EH binding protein Ibp1 n=1 Tax=Mycolicibacterium sediminis TaxID=1286180 RepID=A0A7I7R124_9MYCO|nr:hypothetical protein [Mycolicibacterium sediminis]BBY31820.1 hypothetical protein MSEDJ_59160 [Mycolicibacterium sediminis]
MKARSTLATLLAAAGAAALVAAPLASAEPTPSLPQCETVGGSSVTGGQTTECATPGNTEIDATPPAPSYGMFPWEDEFWTL